MSEGINPIFAVLLTEGGKGMTCGEEISRLKSENERLTRANENLAANCYNYTERAEKAEAAAEACTEVGSCGYWREAAKLRAQERDTLRTENERLARELEAATKVCEAATMTLNFGTWVCDFAINPSPLMTLGNAVLYWRSLRDAQDRDRGPASGKGGS